MLRFFATFEKLFTTPIISWKHENSSSIMTTHQLIRLFGTVASDQEQSSQCFQNVSILCIFLLTVLKNEGPLEDNGSSQPKSLKKLLMQH
jgi:hypothetical protein